MKYYIVLMVLVMFFVTLAGCTTAGPFVTNQILKLFLKKNINYDFILYNHYYLRTYHSIFYGMDIIRRLYYFQRNHLR